jgi:hypothetical protein
MRTVFSRVVAACVFGFVSMDASLAAGVASGSDGRWWPVQAMPKAVVRLEPHDGPLPHATYAMISQSVAGLAANAVNEARSDELVWIGTGNPIVEAWLARMLLRHPDLEMRGAVRVWDLIDRYAKKGIIKGYILYKLDASAGDHNEHRTGMDCSVNVATSLSGLLGGVIVDEKLEHEAQAHGLTKLIDVRDKTQAWCFENYRDQFNRHIICMQDPRKSHTRDLAIAQRAFVTYGYDEPTPAVMRWLEPLSPVLGWNGGDEFKTTELSSRWAHIQTSTDWCANLPVLMAGTEHIEQSKAPSFDPRTIDWSDRRSGVSFVSTDGDNVQWYQVNFFQAGEGASYWGNSQRGRIPFGWSCCFAHLAQLCPEAIDFGLATRSANDWFIEWGGGYYYPDLFGLDRANRWELLATHAERTWEMMTKNNTRIIGFNVSRYDSPDARKAYEVFAQQTDGLLAIFVFQYSPYEAGAGETFWVRNRNGIEVPVITARYSIWAHSNRRARAGTPAKVAHEIVQTIQKTPQEQLPRFDWALSHVWSYFTAPGNDENAEDLPQGNAAARQGVRGYTPVVWCAERLPADIRVISPEEMVWRIRMKHNPAQTKALIQNWSWGVAPGTRE